MVPPVEGFHRHICSLQACAAMAAMGTLHIVPNVRLKFQRLRFEARGKLSVELLKWCDDFYDALFERCVGISIESTDVMWMKCGLTEMTNYMRDSEFRNLRSLESVAVLHGVVGHIAWTTLSATRWVNNAMSGWIREYFPDYVVAALRETRENRRLFVAVLNRLYRYPGILDSHVALVTDAMLTAGVQADVRDEISHLDKRYSDHLKVIMNATTDPVERLSVAVNSGNVEYVLKEENKHVVRSNWARLMDDVCWICDPSMFQCLWEFRSSVGTVPTQVYVDLMQTALSGSDHHALRSILRELDEQGIDYRIYATSLWDEVHDTVSTDILLEHRVPVDSAVFCTRDPATVQDLISRGAPLTPPSMDVVAASLSSDIHIAHLLIEAWGINHPHAFEYVREAIYVCHEPRVLHELHDILRTRFHASAMVLHHCVCTALLNADMTHDLLFIRKCVRLGADINVQDGQDGMSVLMLAVLSGNDRLVDYLFTAGASPMLRDNLGKTALDHYDEHGLDVPRIRNWLIHYMNVRSNAGSSKSNPLFV